MRRFGLILLVCGVPAMPALAQTAPQASIDFAVTANPDDWLRTPAPRSSGLVFGAGQGTARVEFGRPTWHEAASLRSPGQRPGDPSRISKEQRRTLSLDLLYVKRYHLTGRLALSWLAGGGYALRASHTMTELRTSTGELVEATPLRRHRRDSLTVVGGADLEVAAVWRLAIVSQLRVHVYMFWAGADDSADASQGVTAEPRIAVRWRFR